MSKQLPRISPAGAATGALICAIGRAAVVAVFVLVFPSRGPRLDLVYVLPLIIPSTLIGVLVGAVAGAFADPWKSAVIGAVLSGLVFEAFMCPCATLEFN